MINEIDKKHKDPTHIVDQKQQEKTTKYLGTVKPYPGHTVFQFNKKTKELTVAEFEDQSIQFGADLEIAKKRRVLIAKKDCIYFNSLNEKNARRKLKRLNLL